MQKRHFQLIADVMSYTKPSRQVKPRGYRDRLGQWESVCESLVDSLRATNSNFDRARFLEACGYNYGE